MPLQIFLGIDQTGATTKSGHAVPLPTAAIYRESSQWILESDLSLASLTPKSLESLVKDLKSTHSLQDTVVLVDSALGLPRDVFPKNKTLFDLMQRAHRFSQDGRKYNAKTAQAFFAQFVEKAPNATPRRECEQLADTASVFQNQPFQKNISGGTFRSWSELGSLGKKWFSLWPVDDSSSQGPWIFEASPALLWKKVIKSRLQDPNDLKAFLLKQKLVKMHPSVLRSLSKPDFCDAIILAYSGFIFHRKKKLFSAPKSASPKKEGWIIGI